MKRIAIIGGGACGLWCASSLKRANPSFEVTVFDRQPQVGKKIAMSGNSRGNITNMHVRPSAYNHPSFVAPALELVDAQRLVSMFEERGILVSVDEEGRAYPLSESAQAVVDVMKADCDRLGVIVRLDHDVSDIDIKNSNYLIKDEPFDIVVIATGSHASLGPRAPERTYPTIKGSDPFTRTARFPSLSAIGVKDDIRLLSGVRVKASMTLDLNGTKHTTMGELQFIDGALSGIAMFELSSYYARAKVNGQPIVAKLIVDLLPSMDELAITKHLQRLITGPSLLVTALEGLLSPKLSQWIINRHETKQKKVDLRLLAHQIKQCEFTIDLDYVPKNYQVVSGGISIAEVDANTLMSHKFLGIYIGGEVLDIDGICGGYNLHFAFASGELIAKSISEKESL